jgi:hypothetical protein
MDAEQLTHLAATEAMTPEGQKFELAMVLDVHCAMILAAQLQLALRHPHNQAGRQLGVVRQFIDGVIARFEEAGLVACATLARAGDNPEMDTWEMDT